VISLNSEISRMFSGIQWGHSCIGVTAKKPMSGPSDGSSLTEFSLDSSIY